MPCSTPSATPPQQRTPSVSTSTAQGKLPHPRSFAAELNEHFLAEELTAGSPYGIILFDFANAELARSVIYTNLLP